MKFDLNTFGGRKFLLAALVVICTAILLWFGKVSDDIYSTIMIAVVGGYIAGNVTQKVTAKSPETKKDPT